MKLHYNTNEVHEILKDINLISNYKIAIFDSDFKEIFCYPEKLSNFCKYIRKHPIISERCNTCDKHAFTTCKRTRKPYIYECHAGLTEILVPIIASNMIIGYVMAGQFYNQLSLLKSWNKTCAYLQNFAFDLETLKKIHTKTLKLDQVQISAIKNILLLVSTYLVSESKVGLEPQSFEEKLNLYIEENIDKELSVELLCHEFSITKTRFCNLAKTLYGKGVMSHIKEIRVEKAKELLFSSKLSIMEIAEKVGIRDYNYFTKVFKSITGKTPRDFKKEKALH